MPFGVIHHLNKRAKSCGGVFIHLFIELFIDLFIHLFNWLVKYKLISTETLKKKLKTALK